MTNIFKVDENRPFYGKFWPNGLPKQLEYDTSMTLGDFLHKTSRKVPDQPAIWFLHSWVKYRELEYMVDCFATSLYNFGVRKGDVVAIHLPNSIQYIVAYYATALIGGIVTGVNPTYKPLEILHQLKITNAKYFVGLDVLYNEFVKPLEDKWNFNKIIWTNIADCATALSPIKKFLGKVFKKLPFAKVEHPKAVPFLECLKTKPNVPVVKIDPFVDPAIYMMTGGTTGVPKAAVLTHSNVVANGIQVGLYVSAQVDPAYPEKPKIGPQTGYLGVLPLFHSFAMAGALNCPISTEGYTVLFPKPPPTEELLETLQSLPNKNGFVYCAVELLFQRIATLPEEVLAKYDINGRIKLCISGAGPLHDYVRDPFEKRTGAKITEGYGLAEATPVVSANNFFGEREVGFIGTPMPGTDWMIFDKEDFSKGPITDYTENGLGEICVCGPQVMKGYLNNPDATNETIREWNGRKWLLTGDIGWMDKYGRIQIKDRKKQLIKVKGFSVFPKDVESLIGTHPKVLEVAVASVPDKITGEAVKAWVALKPEARGTLSVEELIQWCKENITGYKVPKYLEIIDEVPKSAIGKVLRRTLQEADPLWQTNAQK